MSAPEVLAADVTTENLVSVSIVSHGQIALVSDLLNDLSTYCDPGQLEVVLTLNVPEQFDTASAPADLQITVIRNNAPRASEPTTTLRSGTGRLFCVMNPDVGLRDDPFPTLVDTLGAAGVRVAGPKVVSPQGTVEDSGRVFPTPIGLIKGPSGRSERRAAHFRRRIEPQPRAFG